DRHGKNRYKIISAQNSFHGRTFGAISVTGQPNLQKGFEPLVPGIIFVPFGDLAALDKVLDDSIAGVILEPIQGEGGVRLPPEKYLHQAATLIRERGAVLILDEIQSGLGRTGKDFAFRHFDVEPDILTLGKALGCGYPIAATLAKEEPASALGPGTHSTTLGGAPLAMTLALELTQRILDPDFLDRVTQKGLYFQENLSRLKERFPKIVAQIRGLGLFLALELTIPAAPVMVSLREKGFLVNITNVNTLRLVPPLIVSHEEIDLLDKALRETLAETKTP
ncbi:MAG: aminotransferase class III-fold pyridoxal phosphate-dependent enzyme, partial [Deltaproteobacteria bacterium]|nr:aminotransferase class III-fold pyridoxal phosphate-dependent enzyme [Deltaproteobacteria bacterium]